MANSTNTGKGKEPEPLIQFITQPQFITLFLTHKLPCGESQDYTTFESPSYKLASDPTAVYSPHICSLLIVTIIIRILMHIRSD